MSFRKKRFLEKNLSVHREMLGAHNFRLVLGNCIVNAMICIRKYRVKLSELDFYEMLKSPIW